MFDFNDITPEMIARFWSKVDQSGGADACWPYTGSRKAKGYGCFFAKRETPGKTGKQLMVNAHKFAYVLQNGPLDEGQIVRHTCDNPPCCNPRHVVPGTHKDNTQDAIERGRWNPVEGARKALPLLIAYKKAQRTLSDLDIAAIIVARAQGRALSDLSHEYRMSKGTLHDIFFAGTCYKDNPLIQKLSLLYRQGIRFPYYRGNTTPDTIHPALRAVADEARILIIEAHAPAPRDVDLSGAYRAAARAARERAAKQAEAISADLFGVA